MKDFEPPTWRIWEYDIAADDLHSLTDDVTANEGQDVSPHYLPLDTSHPNGRILIASTRQRYSKGVLLIEGKSGFEAQTENGDESAFTLNVLDPTLTGPSAFQQISFNQSHDLNPTVTVRRPHHVHALGPRARRHQRDAPVHDESGRERRRAALRRAQPPGRHAPTRPPACPHRCSSSRRARWKTAACWR